MPYGSFQILKKISNFNRRVICAEDELALADSFLERPLSGGQVIQLSKRRAVILRVRRDSYTITGFVHSPDIFSSGYGSSGQYSNGNLAALWCRN